MIVRERQRGQILVIFAGGLVVILLIAAIVFDIGQNLLDRRTEQNASDAAALAGARHLPAGYAYHVTCSAAGGGMPAVTVACDVAAANGFVDGTGNKTVRVDIPPVAPSTKAGLPGHIEVTIGATRPSFFSGVIGITTQRTGAMGVATNGTDIALPYSLLALDPHGCATNKITGARPSGVTTDGTVHADSDCTEANGGALALTGNGVLTAPECDVVGGIKTAGGATNGCVSAPTGVLVYGDPLRNLPAPPKPGYPVDTVPLDGGPIPDGCPGSGPKEATEAAPALCSFSKSTMGGKHYRIFPGYYPGGIEVSRSTVYMDPGIYWIGGGGIDIKSTGGNFGQLISKDSGDNSGTNPTGGVLIYNSQLPNSAYGSIHLNGGDGSTLALEPIQTGTYKNMVIFVDRAHATGNGDIDLNGGGSTLIISGTIYAPTANVKLNGSDSSAVGTQLICYNFVLNGSGGNMTLNYAPNDLFHLKGVGLVE